MGNTLHGSDYYRLSPRYKWSQHTLCLLYVRYKRCFLLTVNKRDLMPKRLLTIRLDCGILKY